MATLITKNSSTASSVPTAAQLVQGELAVNVTDKRLFTENASGTVVELGTNPSTLALPNGTANGVAYLNGSKVLTTGSALTFDGTSLSTTGAVSIKTANYMLRFFDATGVTSRGYIWSTSSDFQLDTGSTAPLEFLINGSEQMRLTSTGLGIGTSSPAAKLQVKDGTNINVRVGALGSVASVYAINDAGSAYQDLRVDGNNLLLNTYSGGNVGIGTSSPSYKLDVTSSAFTIGRFVRSGAGASAAIDIVEGSGGYVRLACAGGTSNMSFRPGGTELMLLDSSGNLGLGVTPSAWSGVTALQVSGTMAVFGTNSVSGISFNQYYNGTNNIYLRSDYANRLQMDSGAFKFYTAASGTAGNAITFTQALTLDANGKLLVGLTSSTSTNANIQTNKPINLAGYTVAGLPTGSVGDIAYVTDALAPTFLATIVGGGSIKTPVFYNGTNWVAY